MKSTNPFVSDRFRRIHFTGIGGISMSGLAEILHKNGFKVTGSDIRMSSLTDKLTKLGIKVYQGHNAEYAEGSDLLVYNARIRADNPELLWAAHTNTPAIERAALLGYLSDTYPTSIGITGTHGKTTTTSMISMILLEAGLDPTIHIGGELRAISGTTRTGNGAFFVTEADEYSGSFLKLHNHIAVILNIEFDHPDFYRDEDHVRNTFLQYALNVPEDGYIVGCSDDPAVSHILDVSGRKAVTYGLNGSSHDWSAVNISYDEGGYPSFDLVHNGTGVEHIKLAIPGMHNIYNALASAAASDLAGCGPHHIRKALEDFRGAGRRFEEKGMFNGARIVDDYAHHPTEIRANLSAMRNARHNTLWCVFQPHTYTRTVSLFDQFAASFEDADMIIITDIFSASEKDSGAVNSEMLAEKITANGKTCIYIKDFNEIVDYLASRLKPDDLIMTVGAGDVHIISERLAARQSVHLS